MNCDEFEELSAAYVMRALPEDEAREVEAHLASCDKHASLAGLRSAAAALSLAAPEREPPAALKRRLLAAIREPQTTPSVAKPARWLRPSYALAAALAVAVVALLAWNLSLQLSDGGDDGAVVREFVSGKISGRLVYLPESQEAILTVYGLEGIPSSKAFEVWAITDGQPRPIGLFTSRPFTAPVMQADLSQADSVAVTVEPALGSLEPTSDPIIVIEL